VPPEAILRCFKQELRDTILQAPSKKDFPFLEELRDYFRDADEDDEDEDEDEDDDEDDEDETDEE
jgi:hypothetical protein